MKRTVLLLALAALPACGPAGPRTYPVRGKVVAADLKALAGGYVEIALASDPAVRASGEIQPDGSFRLDSNRGGVRYAGAVEGAYQVRVLPPDDDPAAERRARAALAYRYRHFQTSRLALNVPTNGDVAIEVGPR